MSHVRVTVIVDDPTIHDDGFRFSASKRGELYSMASIRQFAEQALARVEELMADEAIALIIERKSRQKDNIP